MPLDIVIGAQWGDEGKGRIVDLLASRADVVVRVGGGDNAGHTVTVNGQIFRLHLIPSGITHPHTTCLLGSGMVINPARLVEEIDHLTARGLDASPKRLRICNAAHIITPAHLALDGAEEELRSKGGLGTTRRGIGPAYTDKAARRGLRAERMRDPEDFGRQVEAHVRAAGQLLERMYDVAGPDPEAAGRAYREHAERLRPHLADTGLLVAAALDSDQDVLAEGAQGTLLDLDHGTYPYVTSSNPTVAGALLGLGVGPRHVRRIIGVTKAFQTRVGTGPFPTEVSGALAERLRGTGENPWDEFGTTTGRPRRCGWLDGVLLRYAARVNSFTELALTKLDILSGIDPIRLAVAYLAGGHRHLQPPDGVTDLSPFEPELEELPGWHEDLTSMAAWDSLPPAARDYVRRVEQVSGVPVSALSVGPQRDQIILRG